MRRAATASGEWLGLLAATIGTETSRLRRTQATAIWAMLTPRACASFSTASITGSSYGESNALTTLCVLDRWLRIYFYGPHSIEMYGHLLREVRNADLVYLHTVPYPHNLLRYLAARMYGKHIVITTHLHSGHHDTQVSIHYTRP
jgi:hypothetical protein